MKKGEGIQYIKFLTNSANFKGITSNKLCNGLIENRFEIPNVSYILSLYTNLKNSENSIFQLYLQNL
ncbi:MAG TPA: hypothetical protein VK982_03175 [Bacteroidales bacterium]|nr:hypothetical protein [Bacteroidales bacterium]